MHTRFASLLLALLATTAAAQPTAFALRKLPKAPRVGDPMPDFTCRDQRGKQVSFHELRGTRKAYLLVIRSASW